jgi:methyl-accepting chemotaxis protein
VISPASEEQSRGIEQVNIAVNQMDKSTQPNAAMVEEAAAAARSLQEQTQALREVVKVFRVGRGGR